MFPNGIVNKWLYLKPEKKRLFKLLAVKADLNQREINRHSRQAIAAKYPLNKGEKIRQIIARVGWSKVDTVMSKVGFNNKEPLNTKSALTIEPPAHSKPESSIKV